MSAKAHLVVEGSGYGREGAAWLTPGGWLFMFEDDDVKLSGPYVIYYSTAGKCKKVLSSRIDALRPVAGMLPCPELVDYLDELVLWLSDFGPDRKLLADYSEIDELYLSQRHYVDEEGEDPWRAGAGSDYILPTDPGESIHAYAAFNVSQLMKVIENGRWDRVKDGLRYIGIADDVWGDHALGREIVIGSDEEAPIEYEEDPGAEGPEVRLISTEEFLRKQGTR